MAINDLLNTKKQRVISAKSTFLNSNTAIQRSELLSKARSLVEQSENRPYGDLTLYAIMCTSSKWEGWVQATQEELPEESPLKAVFKNPYHKEVFTLENWFLFVIELSYSQNGRIEERMQVSTLLNYLRHTMLKKEVKDLNLDKNFYEQYKNGLLHLAKDGIFSTDGRKKTFLDAETLGRVISSTLKKPFAANIKYMYQVITFFLLLLYTGFRPSSILPPSQKLADSWDFLRWKHVTIYRNGLDSQGHVFYVTINIQHLKCRDNTISDHTKKPVRTFKSNQVTEDSSLDFPVFLIAHGLGNDVFEIENFTTWYNSNLVILPIKESWLERPVFYRSSSKNRSENEINAVANPRGFNSCIQKMFRDACVPLQPSCYSLRRNFIKTMQSKGYTREQVALTIGHSYKSGQQFTSYASTFDDLDVVGVILEKKSDHIIELNPYIQGLKSNISDPNIFRLSKNEQDEIVKPIEKKYNIEISILKEEFIAKYKDKWEHSLNETEQQKLQALLNKKQNMKRRLLRKAVKEKMEKIYKDDLKNMKLNEEGNIIEKNVTDKIYKGKEPMKTSNVNKLTDEFYNEDESLNVYQDENEAFNEDDAENLNENEAEEQNFLFLDFLNENIEDMNTPSLLTNDIVNCMLSPSSSYNAADYIPSPSSLSTYNVADYMPSPSSSTTYNTADYMPSPSSSSSFNVADYTPSPSSSSSYNVADYMPSPSSSSSYNVADYMPSPSSSSSYNAADYMSSPSSSTTYNTADYISSSSITTNNMAEHHRLLNINGFLDRIYQFLHGSHICMECEMDDTIKSASPKFKGFSAHITHLLKCFSSSDWNVKKSTKPGQHSNSEKFIRNHAFKIIDNKATCFFECGASWGLQNYEYASANYKRHLKSHHMKNIRDMSIEETFSYLTNYFKKYYGTTLVKHQFDSVVDKTYPQHKDNEKTFKPQKCILCVNGRKASGINMNKELLIRHLVRSQLSSSWSDDSDYTMKSKMNEGVHTVLSTFIQNNPPTTENNKIICPICNQTICGAYIYRSHLKTVHRERIKNLNQTESFLKVQTILGEHYNTTLSKEQWDEYVKEI
ncbi:unnamed protein product [Cunninghamella echinulata]